MNPIINLYVMTSCVFLDQWTHFYSGGTIFLVLMVKLDAIEQILIIDVMEQFVPSIPMKQFVPVEQFFVPMVRLDPIEQILIFVPTDYIYYIFFM